ncbi:MAG: ATP-binding protein [Alicyclobacillus sp.]|nr:ATP-binding protein [Alicyclobacillus sp.]
MAIRLRTDQRVTIIGGTGDGKTTLLLKLAARIASNSRQKVVIINPAAEQVYYDQFGEGRPEVDTRWPDVQHVTPVPVRRREEYGKLFRPILERGNVLLLIDELFVLGSGSQYPLELQWIYQAGRRRNIGVIGITQRPQTVPVFVFTMADHFFVGNVMGTDLRRVEDYTSQRWREVMRHRRQYEFLYWSRHEQRPPRVVRI